MSDRAPNALDAWGQLARRLRRRPSARVAAWMLLALYGMAIFAPFLASDRPLVFEGVDRGAYRKALRELPFVAAELVAAIERGGPGGAGPELRALGLRVETLRRQLDPSHHAPLDDVLAAARRVADASGSVVARDELDASTDRVRRELDVPSSGAAPVAGEVALVPFVAYPLFASLGVGEIYLMALWVVLVGVLLVNGPVDRRWLGGDVVRIRRARRPKVAVVVAVPAAAALVAGVVGAGSPETAVPFKDGLSTGSIEARRVLFAPVPYGLAEQNRTEQSRPPTWTDAARIGEDGQYEDGVRAHGIPVEVRRGEAARNAGARHLLGTDDLGRDLLTRLVWGARVSLAVGLVSTIVLVVIGTILGAFAGYFGGWVDVVISRIIEVFQCFPVFFLVLLVVAFVGQSVLNIMLVLGLVRWTGVARLVRGEFLRLRGLEFVQASEALGTRPTRIIFRHVLPNALGPVLVAATFSVASGILTESALSFLGFGVKLPVPSWGSLLSESRSPEHWWIQVFPGAFIFLTVMLYNLLGEGVRDALDPRLEEA